MAAPNLISTSSIIGKSHGEWITTSPLAIASNSLNSSELYRINVLFITNLGSADATATVDLYRGNVSYKILYNLPVPVGASVVAIGKDTGIYLEEGDSLRISGSAAGILQYLLSYEVMS